MQQRYLIATGSLLGWFAELVCPRDTPALHFCLTVAVPWTNGGRLYYLSCSFSNRPGNIMEHQPSCSDRRAAARPWAGLKHLCRQGFMSQADRPTTYEYQSLQTSALVPKSDLRRSELQPWHVPCPRRVQHVSAQVRPAPIMRFQAFPALHHGSQQTTTARYP